jgi:hypothetical protein
MDLTALAMANALPLFLYTPKVIVLVRSVTAIGLR